jgi:dolichol-phosphate mannosyltransferase
MRPLVVLPTYNERQNLPIVLARLLEIPDVRVLVVDDDSPDGTGAIAELIARDSHGRVSVLHRTGPRGLGRAYVDGLKHALSTDADVICQMDADLSHRPTDLVALLAAVDVGDVVIGSRYVPGGRVLNWPLRRRLLSRAANWYIHLICSMPPRDCTSGFRCWRREALAAVPLDRVNANGYAFLVQLLWEVLLSGQKVIEVPITFVERELGVSKLRLRVLVESAWMPWRLLGTRLTIPTIEGPGPVRSKRVSLSR